MDSQRKLESGHHTTPGRGLESDPGPPPQPWEAGLQAKGTELQLVGEKWQGRAPGR